MKSVEQEEVDSFLKRHISIASCEHFCAGEVFDNWRITAFLGRGGSGEVYRVVNSQNAAVAALKVFARKLDGNDDSDDVAKNALRMRCVFFQMLNTYLFRVSLRKVRRMGDLGM